MKKIFIVFTVFVFLFTGCKNNTESNVQQGLNKNFKSEVKIGEISFLFEKKDNNYILKGSKDTKFENLLLEVSGENMKVNFNDITSEINTYDTVFSDFFSMIYGNSECNIEYDENKLPVSIYSKNQKFYFNNFSYTN